MKRIMFFLLAAVILLAGCGAGSTGSPAAGSSQGKASGQEAGKDIVDNLKTIGDIKQLDDDMVREEAYFEDFYACVIDVDGTLYRLAAELPEDVSKQIWSIDFEDEDRDEKVNELLKPLEITRKDNFSELIIPQEELDKMRAPVETFFVTRDRGAGRPTKKDRRDIEQLWDSLDF